MRTTLTPLTRAIQALGMSPMVFCVEHLGLKYSTFQHRVRTGKLALDDYHRILYLTGKTFEELFANPYLNPVPLNPAPIAPIRSFRVTTLPRQAVPPTVQPPVPAEQKRAEPQRTPPPAPETIEPIPLDLLSLEE